MSKQPNPRPDAADLRRAAEERLGGRPAEADPGMAASDAQRLVHELQVHQIELEMQNEELRKARDEMKAGLDKYSDLYDFAPVGYLTLDREGTIREVNLATATLLGIERSRLVTRRFGMCVSATDRPAFAAFVARVFESKARESCEVTLLKEGMAPVTVRIEGTALTEECRAVVTDVTERNRSEMDRFVLGKLESTGILAGGIAHDFNNLFTILVLGLEEARTLAPAEGELAGLLRQATETVMSARGLTRQLIIFAQGGAPVREPALLSGMIRESVRPALSGSRVRCEFSLADDLWPAEVDEGQIAQVVRNMVLNAREAMPEGGVVCIRAENVTLKAGEIPSLPPGDHVRLSVEDSGRGIAQAVLPKIFDPYFSTKRVGDQKGMGLGLTICHTIIRKHGGAIVVRSAPGVGTTFHVYLPACRKPPGKPKAASPTASRGRILVMDDEEALRSVLGAALRRSGHEVELTGDGRRAIEVYAEAKSGGRPFDLVMLDLTVRAGLGGREALHELLKIDPAVKAVAMSGHSFDPVIVEPLKYGFKGGLPKPFAGGRLEEVVSSIITG